MVKSPGSEAGRRAQMGNLELMKPTALELNGIAGAAFLLRTPGRSSVTLQHKEGVVAVRQGAPYVTVQLSKACPEADLRTEAWRVLQETLDIHAATHREAIGTHRGESEYLVWTRKDGGYHLTFAETSDAPWSSSGQITVGSTTSAPPPAPPPAIPHHPAFRFYRLSQLTDDLFDAYRNAYLSLECLVSGESPQDKKNREKELDWLKRVLGGPLSAGVPAGMDISATVDELYESGRLPLFHAKIGKSFYAPQGEKREHIQELLGTINALLASLFRNKFGDRFPAGWGWMSELARDASARAVLQFDEVVYKSACERSSRHPQVQVIEQPRRFGNLWARLEVAPPADLAYIDAVELRHNGQDWITLEFPESVPMAGVRMARFEICVLTYHARAPKPTHAM
jgi:hypothetical protein